MRSAEGSGRTVEEAIRDALRTLGARREDADLMVLDEGSRGVLGLGSRLARVRLTLLSEMDEGEEGAPEPSRAAPQASALPEAEAAELIQLAQGVATSLIEAMGFHASASGREEAGQIHVSVTGPDLAPLIGRRGQTLDALDLVVNLIVAHRQGRRIPVIVDVERYRERRVETLEDMARRFAERVRRSGRPLALKPMSAAERRIIHTTLAADGGVTTHSEGEDPERRVVITPRGASSSSTAGASGRPQGRFRSRSHNHMRP
ncbi:MAG TPA: RNA-binding cell elongation regulator Jag/EloR [bacterium]|nr:RNA-binding cell elongation regulator Jag/EloR [bacterium]